jgi:hypothetical protein
VPATGLTTLYFAVLAWRSIGKGPWDRDIKSKWPQAYRREGFTQFDDVTDYTDGLRFFGLQNLGGPSPLHGFENVIRQVGVDPENIGGRLDIIIETLNRFAQPANGLLPRAESPVVFVEKETSGGIKPKEGG